jgi:hypothetical protein
MSLDLTCHQALWSRKTCRDWMDGWTNKCRETKRTFYVVYTTVLYEYMKSLRNDVHNLSDNVHVPIKIYLKIYNDIVYITNKWHHIRITFIFGCIEQRTREQIQIIVWQMWVDCQGKVKHILYNHLLQQFSNQIPDTLFNVCI